MTKLAIFKIDEGHFREGFNVTVLINEEGKPIHRTIVGKLPPDSYERSGFVWCCDEKRSVDNPQGIPESYQRWQSDYLSLQKVFCLRARGKSSAVNTEQLLEKCCQSATDFLDAFKTWLRSEQTDFRDFREKLIQEFGHKNTEIRVFIQTEDARLQKLPWHEWDLFADVYTKAEVALCATEFEKESEPTEKTSLKILAILGDSKGIDVESDRQALENLKSKGAETQFLIEPKRAEISDKLFEQNWDILFFAGHSSSQGEEGKILINSTESLTIKQLKAGLKKAIEHGLQLAILNSCDGLKLAEDLADLNIPQVIVMREPVPDRAAQQFLTFFLKAFSEGESLYLAVRQARKRLHESDWDEKYPGASWLPVIYQNPTVRSLSWIKPPESEKKHLENDGVQFRNPPLEPPDNDKNEEIYDVIDDSKQGVINTIIDLFSFKISGLIAGIGGLSLGLVWFIYGYITQADIFPKLTQGQSTILLLSIVGLTFVIAIIGLFAWFAARERVQFKIVLVFMVFVLIIVSFIFVGINKIVGGNGENDRLIVQPKYQPVNPWYLKAMVALENGKKSIALEYINRGLKKIPKDAPKHVAGLLALKIKVLLLIGGSENLAEARKVAAQNYGYSSDLDGWIDCLRKENLFLSFITTESGLEGKCPSPAAKWYRKAAEQGHADAQNNLGVMYATGKGVTQNNIEAVKWFRKAAQQGHADAQNNLGWMYAAGKGVTQNDIEAAKWFRKAAQQGHVQAQNNLGVMYATGKGVTQDYVEAAKWYRKAAQQGYAQAQYNLGVRYDNGEGVTQDDVEAAKWFRKAAEQGHTDAQNNLGWMYATGKYLGGMYATGKGVTQDDVEAAKWFRKAAEQGHADAQNLLGMMYTLGKGVTQNDIEAAKWFRKAAEYGYANAQNYLGWMYATGKGVTQDYVEAAKWYRKAAEQGYIQVPNNLGP